MCYNTGDRCKRIEMEVPFMTEAQVSCFMEVAKYKSFSKAASRMFISQPAVSKQVAILEDSLGVSLFDRSPSGLALTDAGQLFYDFFQRASSEFHTIWDEAKSLATGQTGTIRVGCLDGWDLSTFYPELRDLLEEKYPRLSVSLDGYNHTYVLDALRRKEIDIAITLEIALQSQNDLAKRVITNAPVVMLFSTLNPLANKPALSLADLRDEPFYVISPSNAGDNPMEQLAVEMCQAAGFTPRIEHTKNSASILMRLQSGTGVQVTCAWTGACKLPMYRAIELDRILNISAAWVDGHLSPAGQVFIEEMYRHYHPQAV